MSTTFDSDITTTTENSDFISGLPLDVTQNQDSSDKTAVIVLSIFLVLMLIGLIVSVVIIFYQRRLIRGFSADRMTQTTELENTGENIVHCTTSEENQGNRGEGSLYQARTQPWKWGVAHFEKKCKKY